MARRKKPASKNIDWQHVYSLMYKSKMRGNLNEVEMSMCIEAHAADPEKYSTLKAEADKRAYIASNPLAFQRSEDKDDAEGEDTEP